MRFLFAQKSALFGDSINYKISDKTRWKKLLEGALNFTQDFCGSETLHNPLCKEQRKDCKKLFHFYRLLCNPNNSSLNHSKFGDDKNPVLA